MPPARRRPGLAAPRLAAPDLPAEFSAATARPGVSVWGALIEASLDACDASHAAWEECRVIVPPGEPLPRIEMTGITLRDVALDQLRAVQVSARASRWREVEVTSARVGTLDLGGAELQTVTLRGMRANYLNLAAANLSDVTFIDCVFGAVDVPAASLTRVRFENCRSDEVDTRDARATDLDLRGLDAVSFTDLRGLSGATISTHQVHAHAEAFATALGIRVAD